MFNIVFIESQSSKDALAPQASGVPAQLGDPIGVRSVPKKTPAPRTGVSDLRSASVTSTRQLVGAPLAATPIRSFEQPTEGEKEPGI